MTRGFGEKRLSVPTGRLCINQPWKLLLVGFCFHTQELLRGYWNLTSHSVLWAYYPRLTELRILWVWGGWDSKNSGFLKPFVSSPCVLPLIGLKRCHCTRILSSLFFRKTSLDFNRPQKYFKGFQPNRPCL